MALALCELPAFSKCRQSLSCCEGLAGIGLGNLDNLGTQGEVGWTTHCIAQHPVTFVTFK